MKKTIGLFAIVILATSLADLADADILRYRGSGDWNLITDGSSPGWGPNPSGVGTSLPGASDDARINFGGNTVTVNSMVPTVGRVQIGVDESGTLMVNSGGILSTAGGGDILVGNNNSNATGTLIVASGGLVNVNRILWAANDDSDGVIDIQNGGQVNVGDHLWWGVTGNATIDISGTLNQTGGILGLGTSNASTASGGTAIVNVLDGGLLALNNIDGGGNSIFGSSAINISGSGELTLPGDFVGVLNNYANAGQIVGIGGTLTIDTTRNPGFTTAYVSAIPEPTSCFLVSAFACGLFIRRRS